MGFMEKAKGKLRINNGLIREAIAECLGTFVLMCFGDGSIAQSELAAFNGDTELNNYHSVVVAWGIAVAMGIWVCGGVSGGHLNPAVSGALLCIGRLSPLKFIVYMLAQYVGAILASACIYGVYFEALEEACGSHRNTTGPCATAGIWATYSKDFVSAGTAFGDQLFVCTLIMICILAILDDRNMRPPQGMIPFCIGLIFLMVGLSYGYNCGFPVNPARDLGPRIFTWMAGWGTEPFSYKDYNYWWIPVVGPHLGMIIGAWLYLLLVGFHWPDKAEFTLEQPGEFNKLDTISGGSTNQAYKGPDTSLPSDNY